MDTRWTQYLRAFSARMSPDDCRILRDLLGQGSFGSLASANRIARCILGYLDGNGDDELLARASIALDATEAALVTSLLLVIALQERHDGRGTGEWLIAASFAIDAARDLAGAAA